MMYHWREGLKEEPIQDFTAFASFQASTPGLLFYMIGVILLGAIGSALNDWGKVYWGVTVTSLPTGAVALLSYGQLLEAGCGVGSREMQVGFDGSAFVHLFRHSSVYHNE